MPRRVAVSAIWLAGVVFGQSAAIDRFEVASVKASHAESGSSGINTGHGRLDAHNVTLKRCIMGAYGVGPQQILGGPDWINSDRFEISAKAEKPIDGDAALMVMLQGLLAERFKLAVRRETRTIPAFLLEVAKNGPRMEKAESGESSTNSSDTSSGSSIEARSTSMGLLAKVLERATAFPVVDRTGLQGAFNFRLVWTPDRARPADGAGADAPSLFTAIQEQLGLRLRSDKAPVEVIVVEGVEKPSEN